MQIHDDMPLIVFLIFAIVFMIFITAIFITVINGFGIIHKAPFQDGFPALGKLYM